MYQGQQNGQQPQGQAYQGQTFLIDNLSLFHNGSNTVYVRQTDGAGNVSEISPFEFTLDKKLPAAPTISNQNVVTNNPNATLNITRLEEGATLQYQHGYQADDGWGNLVYKYETTTTQRVFTEGNNSFWISQVDIAGNVSNNSTWVSVMLDMTAPKAASISVDSNGNVIAGDNLDSVQH